MSKPSSSPAQPRLTEVLRQRGLAGGDARRALKAGKVTVHGVPTADGGRLVDPDEVVIDLEATRLTVGRDVAFIHRDKHLVVAWKPAGMLSVPAPRRRGERNVLGEVGGRLGRCFAVHRLDEQTSGLMLVALDEQTQLALKERLEARAISRRYLALVDGHVAAEPKTLHTWIVRNRGDSKRGSVPRGEEPPEGALESITHFRRVELLLRGASLVEARLDTGRTHQVRIHAYDSGHPVLGEPLYAGERIRRRAPRLALHAAWLAFDHPVTGQRMRFHAPLADDLEILRRSLDRERDPDEGEGTPGGGAGRRARGGGKGPRRRGGRSRGGGGSRGGRS